MSLYSNRIWFTCRDAGQSFPISKITPLPTYAVVRATHCKLLSKWSARRHFYWLSKIYCAVACACHLSLEVNELSAKRSCKHTAAAVNEGMAWLKKINPTKYGSRKETWIERESWLLLFVSESSPPTNCSQVPPETMFSLQLLSIKDRKNRAGR